MDIYATDNLEDDDDDADDHDADHDDYHHDHDHDHDDYQGSVIMFPPLSPICRRILSRKKRFLKFSSEKHISQDTSQNQTFIISSPKWISTHMQMKQRKKEKIIKAKKHNNQVYFGWDLYST